MLHILISNIFLFIEKIEKCSRDFELGFQIYVYTKFAQSLMKIYFLNMQSYLYVWNAVKFPNHIWFIYSLKEVDIHVIWFCK